MAEIIKDQLYIGDDQTAQDIKQLQAWGITHIINCTSEVKNYYPYSFQYLKLGLNDNFMDNLKQAIQHSFQFVNSILNSQPNSRFFVHCYAGKSRSCSIVISLLMKFLNKNYEEAASALRKIWPRMQPNLYYTNVLKNLNVQELI
jgi:protein-tyrosine phosphatase